jgi:hypothetical protein
MASKPLKRVSLLLKLAGQSFDFFYSLVDSQSKSTVVNVASAKESRENDDWFGDEVENKRYG